MAGKKKLKNASGKACVKNRNKKCGVYMEVLKLQKKRESLEKEKNSLEKRFSRMIFKTDKEREAVRIKNMKLENESRRLMERLYELNLLEERLLIIQRNPLYEALSGAEEGLKMINYSFGKISIKTAVVSKNINMLRKDISNLRAGKYILPAAEKDRQGIGPHNVLTEKCAYGKKKSGTSACGSNRAYTEKNAILT